MAAIISTIITSLGIVSGYCLGKIAKPELKDGKRYLLPLQMALFLSATFFVLWVLRFNRAMVVAGVLAAFLFLYYFKKLRNWLVYSYLGALHAVALTTDQYLPIAALVFLYGFPTGSYVKQKEELLSCMLAFIVVSLLASALVG